MSPPNPSTPTSNSLSLSALSSSTLPPTQPAPSAHRPSPRHIHRTTQPTTVQLVAHLTFNPIPSRSLTGSYSPTFKATTNNPRTLLFPPPTNNKSSSSTQVGTPSLPSFLHLRSAGHPPHTHTPPPRPYCRPIHARPSTPPLTLQALPPPLGAADTGIEHACGWRARRCAHA